MEDLKPLYQAIEDTKKAISEGNRDLAEKLGREMCNLFEASYQVDEETYTPEMCRLQLGSFATILELHIMRGEPMDISFRYGLLTSGEIQSVASDKISHSRVC